MAHLQHRPTNSPSRRAPLYSKFLALCLLPTACASAPLAEVTSAESARSAATSLITRWVEKEREVGFSYLIVSKEGPLFSFQKGRLDAAAETQVDPETMFLSASTTKVVTAMAVLRLVDQGRLRLEDPLSLYLPEQPYGREVTIQNLLTHSAGVPNPLPLKWVHTGSEHHDFNESRTLVSVLAENSKLEAPPGKEYRYTNLGYWLLGAAIERVSGQKYAEFVREEVLRPLALGADELTFDAPPSDRAARGHYECFSMLGLAVPLLTDPKIRQRASGRWGRLEHVFMNGPAYGGAFATARGYGKLLADLLNDESRVLSRTSRAALFSAQTDRSGRPLGVTLAFRNGNLEGTPYFGKPGGGPGFSSNIRIYPDLGLATVFLSNRMRVTEDAIEKVADALDAPFLRSAKTQR